jgi:hypothetical protein
LRKDRQ